MSLDENSTVAKDADQSLPDLRPSLPRVDDTELSFYNHAAGSIET